ncbi:MAG: hypothetical protein WCH31_07695 [Actinomycetes bacterium]
MRAALASLLIASGVALGSLPGAGAHVLVAPTFVAPAAAPPVAAPGQPYRGWSVCEPKPAPGHTCGGPLNKGQRNPHGGQDGPYVFAVAYGFLPTGLRLSSRTGYVSGTVDRRAERRAYRFMVCTSDTSAAPKPGTHGTACIATTITVSASTAYDGTYEVRLTGTYTDTRNGDVYPLHGGAHVYVSEGRLVRDSPSNPVTMTGAIGAKGVAKVQYFGMTRDTRGCSLTLHFTTSGTTAPLAYHCALRTIAESGTMSLKRLWTYGG